MWSTRESSQQIFTFLKIAMNVESRMGTVISRHHLTRIANMVDRTSGKILVGGHCMHGPSPLDGYDLSKGNFYAPTLIEDVSTGDEMWKEEVFGPVAVVKRFSVRPSSFSNRIGAIVNLHCCRRSKRR